MLTDKHIQTVLMFLSRVKLTGNEAPAFMECVTAMQTAMQGAMAPDAETKAESDRGGN